MIITFSGLDGSGKTTQALFAQRYIKDLGYDCSYRHAIKDSIYYRVLHGFVAKVSPEAKSGMEGALRTKGASAKKFLFAWIKKFLLLFEVIYFKGRYFFYSSSGAKNVVCDRYFYDELAQALHLGMAGILFSGVYKRLIPRPDIAFLLKVDPFAAFGRKHEYDKRYFVGKKSVYDAISDSFGLKVLKEAGKKQVSAAVSVELERLFSEV